MKRVSLQQSSKIQNITRDYYENYTLNTTLDNPEEIVFLNVLTPKKIKLRRYQ